MKVFYHDDLDGKCSAAIVRFRYPEIKVSDCYCINYGMPFPWDIINPNEKVFVVDFCLQPFDDMVKLYNILGTNLIWIDHHKTAIEAYENTIMPEITGLRRIGTAGCELTWEYCFHPRPIPLVVHLLGRYDVWDLYDDKIFQFQMGMRAMDYSLDNSFWKESLATLATVGTTVEQLTLIDDIINKGKLIVEWEEVRAREYCAAYGIETFLNGYRAMAVNVGRANSQFFYSYFNKDDYDMFIYFTRLPSRRWSVGLMGNNDDVDVGEIAKGYGGGGHKGAAGFSCIDLPFDI